jgi:hypothetical protein
MRTIAYLAMDVRARSSTLGHTNDNGTFRGTL